MDKSLKRCGEMVKFFGRIKAASGQTIRWLSERGYEIVKMQLLVEDKMAADVCIAC